MSILVGLDSFSEVQFEHQVGFPGQPLGGVGLHPWARPFQVVVEQFGGAEDNPWVTQAQEMLDAAKAELTAAEDALKEVKPLTLSEGWNFTALAGINQELADAFSRAASAISSGPQLS